MTNSCSSCAWWAPVDGEGRWGRCLLLSDAGNEPSLNAFVQSADPESNAYFVTRGEFGCSEWTDLVADLLRADMGEPSAACRGE